MVMVAATGALPCACFGSITTDFGSCAASAAIARGFTNGMTLCGGVLAFGLRSRSFTRAPAIGDANEGIAIVPRRFVTIV
jgi:hypothetical protein